VIHDLKPYPTYKDSGVPWLGDLPEHWSVLPNRSLFAEVRERNHPNEEMLSVTITEGIIRQRILLADSSKTDSSNEDKTSYKLVLPGEIAYNKMRLWQGAVGVSLYRGIVSPAYVVVRLRKSHDPRYFHYLLRTPPFAKEAERWSYGITSDQWSLRPEHFKMIYCSLPPLSEQATIVRFLDYMDHRIRRYIRSKLKLITLLNEQKRAIIHQAVTRGLDPNVRLKPSGIEWLGDVPMLWNEALLGRCLQRIDQGWSPVAAEGDILKDQWAVLTLSSVKQGLFNATAIKPIPISAKIPDDIEIKDRDLLLTRSNTRELVGDACIVQSVRPRTIICDLIYRLIPEPTIFEPSFLMFQLLSPLIRGQIERDARGSSGTMPKISQRHIRTWRVLVPPLEEQRSIVETIENSTKNINDAMIRTKTEISLLREYHVRMITDVVTGKIDVREAAARLPAETEDQEPLDETESINDAEDNMVDDLDEALETDDV
jgi:type I restriction enzyme S subunit